MRRVLIPALLLLAASPAAAELVELSLEPPQPYRNGRSWGARGDYVVRRGTARFALRPDDPANRPVVDLELAPRASDGRVLFSADLEIVAPRDLSRASGILLYDVNNRGNPVSGMFETGAEGFLLERGVIRVSSGWIGELLPGNGRLRLQAPPALQGGRAVTGRVRCEMAPEAAATRLSLAHWANHGSYPPRPELLHRATLTRRVREADLRVPVPRSDWSLEVTRVPGADLPLVELQMPGGFRAGELYELIYDAEGARVMGTGMTGIRDLVSFLKYEASPANPFYAGGRSRITHALGFGISQSARLLRRFLYDGFNADERGRQVFDGMIPLVAGAGMGFFNHRFASPTRHNAQHDNHLYPVDEFPFAYGDTTDPYSRRRDGILRAARRRKVVPKIFHIQTSAEYWHRAGALVHTTPDGRRDLEIPSEVRIYAVAGQHGPGTGLPPGGRPAVSPNQIDYRPLLRALYAAMEEWLVSGKPPPPSRYPSLSAGSLTAPDRAAAAWRPELPVEFPKVIHQPRLLDHGPDYRRRGRLTLLPPAAGPAYEVMVPALDGRTQEWGMIRPIELLAPCGIYTGWRTRTAEMGAPGELLSLQGLFIPAAAPYRSAADFAAAREAGLLRLLGEGWLLAEDLPLLRRRTAEIIRILRLGK